MKFILSMWSRQNSEPGGRRKRGQRQIVDRLRKDGYPVLYVNEASPGISDEDVLSFANANDAVLLTADKDFGELVFRQGRIVKGVILMRLAGLSAKKKADIVSASIRENVEKLGERFTVITPGLVRISKKYGEGLFWH